MFFRWISAKVIDPFVKRDDRGGKVFGGGKGPGSRGSIVECCRAELCISWREFRRMDVASGVLVFEDLALCRW